MKFILVMLLSSLVVSANSPGCLFSVTHNTPKIQLVIPNSQPILIKEYADFLIHEYVQSRHIKLSEREIEGIRDSIEKTKNRSVYLISYSIEPDGKTRIINGGISVVLSKGLFEPLPLEYLLNSMSYTNFFPNRSTTEPIVEIGKLSVSHSREVLRITADLINSSLSYIRSISGVQGAYIITGLSQFKLYEKMINKAGINIQEVTHLPNGRDVLFFVSRESLLKAEIKELNFLGH